MLRSFKLVILNHYYLILVKLTVILDNVQRIGSNKIEKFHYED